MSTPGAAMQDTALDAATAAYQAGDFAAASGAINTLLEQRGHDHRVLHLAAQLALAEGRFQDCEKLLERALAAGPQPAEQAIIWRSYGQLGKAVNNLDHAEESFRRAVLLDPASMENILEFAEILRTRDKTEAAIEVLRSALTRHPRDPNPCAALGNVLLRAGRQRDSLAFFDMALQRDPNFAAAHFNAGVALTMLGKFDAARTACKTALQLDPAMTGYYQLASLDGIETTDPVIPQLQDLLQRADAPMEARIDAGFALSRVYDGAGDSDRSFPPLKQANDLKRSSIDYDIANDEERVAKIMAFFTPDFFRRFPPLTDSKLAPIFILGMPRSGTTLTEQMLAGHTKVQSGGELSHMVEIARQLGEIWGDRGEASPGTVEQVQMDLRNAVESYARRTAALQRRPYFTDKMPGNFMFIGLLHLMFPDARIIHCRRDPVDTCLSCYQRLFTSFVPYSFDLTELGRYYRLYQKLMAHWHAVLPPGRILDVDYESVVVEPEQNVRRILDFCGLGFEPACLEFHDTQRAVTTASAVQVRKPLYTSSVQRWKKYGSHLDPLLAALGMEPVKT